ncbi:MAG: IMP dehydrogenase [Candidatus Electryoneaceae bacterium]|nr:IMP dehydrogenase [Candidatus Electryoneaceae bacterium]
MNINNENQRLVGTGLTFDDVLMVPRYSTVLPGDVTLKTWVTRGIQLNLPLMSAAMDTVTESKLAIAIAQEGGIGIIHKNLTIEEQAHQVRKVKRSESFTIPNPITLPPDVPLSRALGLMRQYNISGIPIITDGKLVGMLTHRDIRFVEDIDHPVSDYMTPMPLVITPVGTTLDQAWEILHKQRVEKLPVVDDQGYLKGLITAKDIQKKRMFPNACKDDEGRLLVGAAVGVAAGTMERVAGLVEAGVDLITVDTAHGHSEKVIRMVEKIKKQFSDVQILAGNVATADGARDLVSAGVDGVKVGIGAGAICTTRIIAGIGLPQFSAVLACAQAVESDGIPVVADGGIRYSGDIAKALAAGANTVMLGSLFAGVDESPGEIVLWEGRSYKIYYGMGSLAAMKKGSADRYFQEDAEPEKLVPEGIEGRVPYKGKLADVIFQLMGGLRASMGYCGCPDIRSFQHETEFIRITNAGVRESHPHDVAITRESPNYQAPQ